MSDNCIYYGWGFGHRPNSKYVSVDFKLNGKAKFDISAELRNWFHDTNIGYCAAIEQREQGWVLIIEITDDIEFAIFRLAFPDL